MLFGLGSAFVATGLAAGCNASPQRSEALPPSSPNPESPFGIDQAINMASIDDFLNREDVVYRDMRLLEDPARYEDIGGSSILDYLLEGFEVVPYPYVGTLAPLPVDNPYSGPTLYKVDWSEDGKTVFGAIPCYEQSSMILEELFPKGKPIFFMCGGGGYAAMAKALLTYLGWDEKLLYNTGGAWDYNGGRIVQIVSHAGDSPEYYLWRAPVRTIDFSKLR